MSAPLSLERFGIAVGHATDVDGGTGCTVIRGIAGPHRAAVSVLGRATGSRELALLEPGHLVDRIDAVFLTGGSAYGLDATAGVMRWMEEQGRGFPVGPGVVPIVPGAVIFDLLPLGSFRARPTPEMAYAACASAVSVGISEGSVGAGTGATVGKALGATRGMKGGVGIAVAQGGSGAAAAIVVVNAFGDVRDDTGAIIAGARRPDGGFLDTAAAIGRGESAEGFLAGTNTTLAVIAMDRPYSGLELRSIARSATAAMHRHITPAGTSADGDIVFALAPMDGEPAPLAAGEQLATQALGAAITRAVRAAVGREGIPGLADGRV